MTAPGSKRFLPAYFESVVDLSDPIQPLERFLRKLLLEVRRHDPVQDDPVVVRLDPQPALLQVRVLTENLGDLLL